MPQPEDISTLVGSYPRCSHCGGDRVTRDAWATWNTLTCTWSLSETFDTFFCDTCADCSLDWHVDQEFRKKRIKRLNDAMRQGDLQNGTITLTQGIQALGKSKVRDIAGAIAEFDTFTTDSDPHGEHDFGSFQAHGQTIFWKIDYFDRQLTNHSPDPANPDVTHRVLTIMLASEY